MAQTLLDASDEQLVEAAREFLRIGAQRPARPNAPPSSWNQLLEEDAREGLLIKGTRIKVEHVLERYLLKNQSASAISENLGLAQPKVDAVLAYFNERPVEATAALADFMRKRTAIEEALERKSPVGLKQRLQERVRLKEQDHGPAPVG